MALTPQQQQLAQTVAALYQQAGLPQPTKSGDVMYYVNKGAAGIELLKKNLSADKRTTFFKSGGYDAWKAGGSPTTTAATPGGKPGDEILNASRITPEQKEGFEKKAYHDYLRDYGIEIPELTSKYGLPEGYNPATTQFGLANQGFDAQTAMFSQNLGANLEQLDLDRRQTAAGWAQLAADIEAGRIEAGSEQQIALERNLQGKTDALENTRRSLSARGTLFGGLATKRLGEAERPYVQQEQDIQRQYQQQLGEIGRRETAGQSDYDIAMDRYLGNKKGAQIQYGAGNANADMQFGGGTWDPTSGTFQNAQYNLTPQQAQAQGLTFFGTDPYNLLIQRQQRRRDLENMMRGGIAGDVSQQEFNYLNY